MPRRYLRKGALPEISAETQCVALVRHCHLLLPVRFGEGESGLENPLHALARRNALLNGHLIGRSFLEDPANSYVQILRVFAKYSEIDVLFRNILQRGQLPVEQSHRPYVGVQIETEADAEENISCMLVVRDARVSQGAQENRVKLRP